MGNFISIILSIIAVLISGIAATFTGLTYYRKYHYKKNCLKMTVCEHERKDNRLTITVLFCNLGNQIVTLTNCYISIGYGAHNENCKIEPFSLLEGIQKSIIISSNIPIINKRVDVFISINCIDSKGDKRHDYINIGYIDVDLLFISYESKKLLTDDLIEIGAF